MPYNVARSKGKVSRNTPMCRASLYEINPEAKRHSRAYSRDDEASAFEEDAFNNPNRETSYAARG